MTIIEGRQALLSEKLIYEMLLFWGINKNIMIVHAAPLDFFIAGISVRIFNE